MMSIIFPPKRPTREWKEKVWRDHRERKWRDHRGKVESESEKTEVEVEWKVESNEW